MWPYCFRDYFYTTLFDGRLAFSKLNASDYGDLSDTQDEGTKTIQTDLIFRQFTSSLFPLFSKGQYGDFIVVVLFRRTHLP